MPKKVSNYTSAMTKHEGKYTIDQYIDTLLKHFYYTKLNIDFASNK
jgi:hypothetical protein